MDRIGIGYSPEGKFKKRLIDKTHNGLKCYEIVDGEITGMSLVTTPAHSEYAAIISEQDMTIGGPVLIPDKMIYRINPITGEEHYIFFTMEVIEKLALKYQKQIWTIEERFTLVNMYAEGKTTKDISGVLNRNEQEIIDKIEIEGEAFIQMVVVLMSQKNKTTMEIASLLKISHETLLQMITKMGGKLGEK